MLHNQKNIDILERSRKFDFQKIGIFKFMQMALKLISDQRK
jgi:hypothetical protein